MTGQPAAEEIPEIRTATVMGASGAVEEIPEIRAGTIISVSGAVDGEYVVQQVDQFPGDAGTVHLAVAERDDDDGIPV